MSGKKNDRDKNSKKRSSSKEKQDKKLLKKTSPKPHDNKKWLTFLLEYSLIGMWEWNLEKDKLKWSSNAHAILGIPQKVLLKGNRREYLNYIHRDDKRKLYTVIEEAIDTVSEYHIEHRLIDAEGQVRWIESFGKAIPNKKGKPVKLTGTIQDISSKKSIEFDREDWKTRLQLISASAGLAIYDYDVLTGSIIWSGNVYEVLGYAAGELGSIDNWVNLIHPEDKDEAFRLLEQAQKDGRPYDVCYRFLAKSKGYCYFHDRGFFVMDENGKANRLLGMMTDVSEQRQADEAIKKSEESYRELFDTVGQAIYIQSPDGTFIDVNKGACGMYGYEKKDFIGNKPEFLSASDKNDFDALKNSLDKAVQGIPQSFEWWGKKKNGEEFLKEVRLTRGTYFGKDIVIATAFDITERRNAEEELRDSEQRFRTLQQASFGGIGLHNKGIIIDCNQGLCDITGYSYTELIFKNGLDLIAPEWRNFVREKIESGYEKTYDVEGIRKDGSRYFLEIHGKNIPHQGKLIRVTEFRDITDRKRSEEKILEQNARLVSITDDLKRKNEQLEEFTQIVSHNLRSPVGNILTLISFFENSENEDEKKEYLKFLKEASLTTLNTLHELNEVLKIKQNKNIETQELQFEKIFSQVKSMLNAKIAEIRAEVISDFNNAPTIEYPNIYLESIMLNLLSNALKYSHPDRKPLITFRSNYDSYRNIVLTVADNGIGLNLERYGHQMFKLRKTFHRHPESRGIGLFMIKNQIEAMGGEITVSSEEDTGTTFTINFTKNQDGK